MQDIHYILDGNDLIRLTIEDEQDTSYFNPREDYSNLGKMICCHPHYILGDEQADLMDYIEELTEQKHAKDDMVLLPLSLYDHSGITMYVGNPQDHFDGQWDCSFVGFIYATKEMALDWGYDEDNWKEQTEKILRDEVKTYDLYLRGCIYWFKAEKFEDGDWVEIESCGGHLSDKYGEELAIEIYGYEGKYISETEAKLIKGRYLYSWERAIANKERAKLAQQRVYMLKAKRYR